MSEFLEVVSPNAKKELSELNAELLKTISNVQKINSMPIGGLTPSGANDALKSLTIEYQKQEKIIQNLQLKLQKAAENQVKNIEKQRLAEIKLSQDREKAFDKYEKQYQKEQARLSASQNIYNKVQAKLNALTNEYKALATKKELGLKLTEQEEQKYNRLQNSIQKYDKTLKAVDASMGKYQRNVGNYASAFSPLSNSINQLTREMPAFANSVQTGFMAISNNLPIFFDAIQQTKAKIAALRAQGQQVPSLFSQMKNAVFSWGTALSVGVTLLTVFGDEIANVLFNTKAKARADELAAEAVRKKGEAEKQYISTIKNNAGEEISRSKILFENAKNVNLSMKERKEAIDELRERYPAYLKNLSDQEILAGKTAKVEKELNQALINRGIAHALQDKLKVLYGDLTAEIIKQKKAQVELSKIYEKTSATDVKGAMQQLSNLSKQTDAQKYFEQIQIKYTKGVLKRTQDEMDGINRQIKAIFDLYNTYSPYLDVVNETSTAISDKNKESKKEIEAIELTAAKVDSLILKLEEEKKAIQEVQLANSKTHADWMLYQQTIDAIEQTIQMIKTGMSETLNLSAQKGIDEFHKYVDAINSTAESQAKLKEITDSYLQTFTSDFFSKAGMPTLFKALNDEIVGFGENWKVTFNSLAEIAQEAFAFIQQASENRRQQQAEDLKEDYELALLFAGDEADARAEIEREYKRRQKELKRQEAKQKKQEALFNIGVDTAQAIVGLWAKPGFPAAIPLAITVAAIGALQAGIVASQPLPEYWKGTDNASEGWAWTQEKGREIITDSKGVVKSTGSDKGRALTYLNKGDKVFTAAKTKEILFNDEFNNILNNNGILPPTTNVNIDLSPIKEEISGLRSDIKNAPRNITVIDKNGIKTYEENNRYSSEIRNRKVMFKGINFGN